MAKVRLPDARYELEDRHDTGRIEMCRCSADEDIGETADDV